MFLSLKKLIIWERERDSNKHTFIENKFCEFLRNQQTNYLIHLMLIGMTQCWHIWDVNMYTQIQCINISLRILWMFYNSFQMLSTCASFRWNKIFYIIYVYRSRSISISLFHIYSLSLCVWVYFITRYRIWIKFSHSYRLCDAICFNYFECEYELKRTHFYLRMY